MLASEILNQIIEKGGLMGACANCYVNDPAKTDKFIEECYDHCHSEGMQDFWGKELVSEIIKFHDRNLFLNTSKN